jgi:hypothetical protein
VAAWSRVLTDGAQVATEASCTELSPANRKHFVGILPRGGRGSEQIHEHESQDGVVDARLEPGHSA